MWEQYHRGEMINVEISPDAVHSAVDAMHRYELSKPGHEAGLCRRDHASRRTPAAASLVPRTHLQPQLLWSAQLAFGPDNGLVGYRLELWKALEPFFKGNRHFETREI